MIKLRTSSKTIPLTLESLTELTQNCTTYSLVESLAQEYFNQPWDSSYDHVWCTIGFLSNRTDLILDVPTSSPYIALLQTWAQFKHDNTLSHLPNMAAELNPAEHLVASCALAELQQHMGEHSWHTTLEGLSGKRYLGSLLSYTKGVLHMRDGNHQQAIDNLKLAQMHMSDSYWKSALYQAIGWACWHQGLTQDANKNFQLALVAANKSRKARVRSQAHLGLATVQLHNLELGRAYFSFCRAIEHACDNQDQQQATWGKAHVLRLTGHLEESRELFTEALSMSHNTSAWLWADIAACYALEGDNVQAQASLEHYAQGRTEAYSPQDRSQMLAELVMAQLQQRSPHIANADLTWLKQEALCFSSLQAYKQEPTGNSIEVKAAGTVELSINGYAVPLGSLRRAEELLVLMMEHDGKATQETIVKAMFPKATLERGRKSLYPHMLEVRQLLGWDNSIKLEGGQLLLDPKASWTYDMHTVNQPQYFMSGHFGPWVSKRRKELNIEDTLSVMDFN